MNDIPLSTFKQEFDWARKHLTRCLAAVDQLPDLTGIRLACSMHLDLKMAPLVEGLIGKGAEVFLSPCNPTTVQNDMVEFCQQLGAQTHAWRDMSPDDWEQSFLKALAWQPTHLCEMGADLSYHYHKQPGDLVIQGSLEATGSGITRLNQFTPQYPIFNWDDLPVKEGLHNRHMVGLTAWHTFFQTTRLTLHEKRVAVIGYGLVGQGVAAAAKAYGGQVTIVEKDRARILQAKYDGWPVADLSDIAQDVDVIATATGAKQVVTREHIQALPDNAFLLNVGHVAEEIDLAFLNEQKKVNALPYVDGYNINGKTIYLLADGSMLNLTAGYGDSLNAFDVTLAVLVSGIKHLIEQSATTEPGLYLLPKEAWDPVL